MIDCETELSAERYLFVYGTLMSTASSVMGRSQRRRLQREARSLGPATLQGRLYHLGRYPGLTDSTDLRDVAHGEVYELTDSAGALRWLDAYEGLVPGGQKGGEYVRVQRPVRLACGTALSAWVYLHVGDLSRARRVADGRWISG